MGVVRVKPGVQFTIIAPGGFCILAAIQHATEVLSLDLTITSACDGMHSGPEDPHHRGEAYDIHTYGMTNDQKQAVLTAISEKLGPRFYCFLESPGTDNEHIHCQVKKGTIYP